MKQQYYPVREFPSDDPAVLRFHRPFSDLVALGIGCAMVAGFFWLVILSWSGSSVRPLLLLGLAAAIAAVLVLSPLWASCAFDTHQQSIEYKIVRVFGAKNWVRAFDSVLGVGYDVILMAQNSKVQNRYQVYLFWKEKEAPIAISKLLDSVEARTAAESIARRSGLPYVGMGSLPDDPPEGILRETDSDVDRVILPPAKRQLSKRLWPLLAMFLGTAVVGILLNSIELSLQVIITFVAIAIVVIYEQRKLSPLPRVIEASRDVIRFYEQGPDGPVNESQISAYRRNTPEGFASNLTWLRHGMTLEQGMWVQRWLRGRLEQEYATEPIDPIA